MKTIRRGRAILGAVGLVLVVAALVGVVWTRSVHRPVRTEPVAAAGSDAASTIFRQPLAFEPNQGQAPGDTPFVARGPGYEVGLSASAAALRLPGAGGPVTLQLRLLGARAGAPAAGDDRLPGTVNYFLGDDPSRWRTKVPTFGRVQFDEVYPGVDVAYYGTEAGRLEYDFIVAPGADPAVIEFAFDDATALRLRDGRLRVESGSAGVTLDAPVAYQEADGGRQPVEAKYRVTGERRVAFALGEYDRERELVIDPEVLFSGYIGGSGTDGGLGVAVDPSGFLYVVGETDSAVLPSHNAVQPTLGGGTDAFITQRLFDGTVVFTTYLGGSGLDVAEAVAIDDMGAAYVTGTTESSNFPRVSARQTTLGGTRDAFVLKIDASGSSLHYSTYHGGSGAEYGYGIAVESGGRAYVVGQTDGLGFPLVNSFDSTKAGVGPEGFVSCLSADGSTLDMSSYLGGSSGDTCKGVALDAVGKLYLTGSTQSSDLPMGPAYPLQPVHMGGFDAFACKIDCATWSINYTTWLGGSGDDFGNAIAVDSIGEAYVVGETQSSNFSAIVTDIQGDSGGGSDAFLVQISSFCTLTSGTYLGGSGYDAANGVAFSNGHVMVAGTTDGTGFPVVDALPSTATGTAGFVADIDVSSYPDHSAYAVVYNTLLSGAGNEQLRDVAALGRRAYATGVTDSASLPFGVTDYSALAGGYDALLVGLAPELVVTNTNPSGAGSLADAVAQANASPGRDVVKFNIPTSDGGFSDGVWSIALSSGIQITDSIVLDGRTQTTAQGNTNTYGPEVVVSLPSGTPSTPALRLTGAPDSAIWSVVINQTPNGPGLSIGAGSDRTLVRGCYVGTSPSALSAQPCGSGIVVSAADCSIGGSGLRLNVSGNSGNGITANNADSLDIVDCQIGVNGYGTAALGNGGDGIVIQGSSAACFVASTVGLANGCVISGNGGAGLRLSGSGVRDAILSNLIIGGNTTMNGAIANNEGVVIEGGATNTRVGNAGTDSPCVILGNTQNGVRIEQSTGNRVQNCYIGTNPNGLADLGNGGSGVICTTSANTNWIGGGGTKEACVISGNGVGVQLSGSGACSVSGNLIGVKPDGSGPLPNDVGVLVGYNSDGNLIGGAGAARNVISGNGECGVIVQNDSGDNSIAGNTIGLLPDGVTPCGNDGPGILLESAGNFVGVVPDGGNVLAANGGDTGTDVPAANLVIQGSGAVGNEVVGNTIGLTVNGDPVAASTDGIALTDGATGNAIGLAGQGNTVCAQGNAGILVSMSPANAIVGNFIGTDSSGTAALGNGSGIRVEDDGHGTVIGGLGPGEGNLVSGNTGWGVEVDGSNAGIQVLGNRIGTVPNGQSALPNSFGGVRLAGVFMGDGSGGALVEDNLISGNDGPGVRIENHDNAIVGNTIGLAAGGVSPLGNAGRGVSIEGSANLIEGNTISGNGSSGVGVSGVAPLIANELVANRIGTSVDGAKAVPNDGFGVYLGDGAETTLVGGARSSEAGNVIAGNTSAGVYLEDAAQDNVIDGNVIGLAADGATPLGNGNNGISVYGPDNVVGSDDDRANVIGANTGSGIALYGTAAGGCQILRNFIGTSADGTGDLGNQLAGILLDGAHGALIGADTDGSPYPGALPAGNVIAGNGWGISLDSTTDVIVRNNLIGEDTVGGFGAANQLGGILVAGATGTQIAPNLILGNGGIGVRCVDSGSAHVGDNIITGNAGHGVQVVGTSVCQASYNRFGGNGGLAIDLVAPGDTSTGVTLNDANDLDGGPNQLVNFPVIEAAVLAADGMTLDVYGWARPGQEVAIHQADRDPTGFGEGALLLCDGVEGTSWDGDDTSGSYSGSVNGLGQGSDTTARFHFVTSVSGLAAGDAVTALGRDSGTGATSEFGGCATVCGPPASLVFTAAPGAGIVAEPLGTVTVEARDAGGRRAAGFSGDVTLALVDPQGATLGGTVTRPAVSGVVSFTGLTIDRAGSYRLAASASGPSSAQSGVIALSPGPPAALAFSGQPGAIAAGVPFDPAVELAVTDAHGTPTGEGLIASVSLSGGATGALLIGTATGTVSGGKVALPGLSVDRAGSGYVLTASLRTAVGQPPLLTKQSNAFSVAPAAPDAAKTTLTVAPATVPADGVATAALTLTLRDAYGNAVPGLTATFSAAPAAGVTLSPASAVSGADGRAQATVASSTPGVVTLTATAGSQSWSVGLEFTPQGQAPPDASRSSLTVSPAQATADGASPVTLTVVVRDAGGAPLAGRSVQLSAEPADGVALTQPAQPTDSAGRATATATSTRAGAVTFRAALGGGAAVAAPPVAFVAGPPDAAASTLTFAPPAAVADGASAVTVTLTLRDAHANPIGGAAVTFGSADGLAPSPAQAVTNAAGQATTSITSTRAGTFGITAQAATSTGTVTKSGTATFTATAPDPARCSLTVSPGQVVADGATPATLSLIVRDANDNPVVGQPVTFVADPAEGVALDPAQTVTDADGAAQALATRTRCGSVAFSADLGGGVGVPGGAVLFVAGAPCPERSSLTAAGEGIADGQTAVNVTARVVDTLNNPIPGATVTFSVSPADGAAVAPASATTDVEGVATAAVTSVVAGERVVTADVNAGGAGLQLTAPVRFSAGPVDAARSTFTADRSRALGDDADTVTLQLVARDAQGNAVPGAAVALALNEGCPATLVGGSVTGSDGGLTATLTAPEPTTAEVSAAVDGVDLPPVTVTFELPAASAEESSVTLAPGRIAADGVEEATVTVVVCDRQARPIRGLAAGRRRTEADPVDSLQVEDAGTVTGDDGTFVLRVRSARVGEHWLSVYVDDVLVGKVKVDARAAGRLVLKSGLQFVGLPPVVPDADAVPCAAGGRVAQWSASGQAYLPPDSRVDPAPLTAPCGIGFWVQVPADTTVCYRGAAMDQTAHVWDLQPGWNALANPFGTAFAWDLTRFTVEHEGTPIGKLGEPASWDYLAPYTWIYDREAGRHRLVFDTRFAGFESTLGRVPAGAGFWVKVLQPGVRLTLANPAAAAGRSRAELRPTLQEWSIGLVARGSRGDAAEAAIGTSARLGRRLLVQAPPDPVDGSPVQLRVLTPSGPMVGDLRTEAGREMSWEVEVSGAAGEPLTLSWPGFLRQAPAGLVLELEDESTGQRLLLNTRAGHRIAAGPRRLRLTARLGRVERSRVTHLTAQPTRGRGLDLVLTLTGPAEVSATVRGLGGRVVRELPARSLDEGNASLAWDGRDSEGRPVPAGSYRVEVTVLSANGAAERVVRTVVVR